MYVSTLIKLGLCVAWGAICGTYIPHLGLVIFSAAIGSLVINKLVD